jgi:hypothetical protein
MIMKILYYTILLAISSFNLMAADVVGYYTVNIPSNGFYMVANHLNTANNTLSNIIPISTDGSMFYKYNNGYSAYVYSIYANGGPPEPPGWEGNPLPTLNPGEAGMFKDSGAGSGQTLIFTGEVLQGLLTNTLPMGNSIRASMVPQSGLLASDIGVLGDDGDQAYVYNNGYSSYVYSIYANGGPPEPPGWEGTLPNGQRIDVGGPPIALGQGFFYKKAPGGTNTMWVRSFTVQ